MSKRRRFTPPRDFTRARRALAAAIAGTALCTALVLTVVPVPITIDGRAITLPAGATAGDVMSQQLVSASRGDMVGVKGGVVKPAAGGPPSMTVGGSLIASDTMLLAGANVRGMRGADVREAVVTTTVAVPAPIESTGTGPDVAVVSEGAEGSDRVTMGELSHAVLTRVHVTAPVPRVVRRREFPGSAKLIALTFDDGPKAGQTEQIIKILQSRHVTATFFMLGHNVQNEPAVARKVAAAGFEIGNHTMDHVGLKKAAPAVMKYQIEAGAKVIKRYTGVTPTWFRPPGGTYNDAVKAEAASIGETLINWGVDTGDWQKPSPDVIYTRTINGVTPGSVVLMHDGGGDRSRTIAALPRIIDWLLAHHYHLVTMSQLKGTGG